MKFYFHLTALAVVLALTVMGCSDSTSPFDPNDAQNPGPLVIVSDGGSNEPLVVPFIAARRIEVGFVTVSNDDTQLCVDLTTEGGWSMRRTRVAFGRTLSDLPLTRKGNLQIGQAPLSESYRPPVTSSTHCFDWTEQGFALGDTLLFVVQGNLMLVDHSGRVRRNAQAWAEGYPLPGRGWAMYFCYVLTGNEGPEPCTLEVTWPNGYENMCHYDVEDITWQSTGGCADVVTLELFQDGYFCHTIVEDTPNTGVFEFDFSEMCEGDMSGYTVRVSDLLSGIWDESDAPFTLEDCGGGGE